MRVLSLSGLLLAAGILPAFADAGVSPVWNDFQPAVSTQYRPPDGGRRYLPPNTRTLIKDRDRQALPSKAADIDRTMPRRTPPSGSQSPASRPPFSSTLPPAPSDPAVRQIDQMGR